MLTNKISRVGGVINPEIISDQFSRHFSQFGETLILLVFDHIFLEGVGVWQPQILKTISGQFSRHFSQFGAPLILFISDHIFFFRGGLKTKYYFRSIFSPFQPIWSNVYFFHVYQQIFLFHFSSNWVNFIWHDKFQLRDAVQSLFLSGAYISVYLYDKSCCATAGLCWSGLYGTRQTVA